MSKKNSSLIYVFLGLICIGLIGYWLFSKNNPEPKLQTNTVVQSKQEPSKKDKNNVEMGIEVGQTVIETTQNLVRDKQKKDSVRLSKREKMYAYQLGIPLKSEKLVLEAYERLSDVEGVVVLKKSKKEYLLLKYEGKDASQLDAALEEYKSNYAGEIIGEIKRIDLMKECGSRKKPILSDKIEKKKGNLSIDCLTCNK